MTALAEKEVYTLQKAPTRNLEAGLALFTEVARTVNCKHFPPTNIDVCSVTACSQTSR